MESLAKPALEVVREGKVKFVPKNWEKTYYEWLENIRDWCISRQIWWGHRIPAWYCKDCGQITVSVEEAVECNKCHSKNIEQDMDVLDTWFSSALWPFSTLGWPDDTPELHAYYPTSVLVTGFDILFFWVARMIMMGLKFMGDIPFKEVYIHALVRDEQGRKMSKSLGNAIDPLVMIEKYGTDAFRFTLTAFAAQGRDISLSERRIEGYRNFCNKIWNATRFILMNMEDFNWREHQLNFKDLELADRWILSRVNQVTQTVDKALSEYRFNEVAHVLYDFVWHEFCDWYIEIVKSRLFNKNDIDSRATALCVLAYVMEKCMRLLHPIMPFITEEIWQKFSSGGKSVMISPYPVADQDFINEVAEQEMVLVQELIVRVRNLRAEMRVPLNAKIKLLIKKIDPNKQEILNRALQIIVDLAKVESLKYLSSQAEKPAMSASIIVDSIEIYVPLGDVIDFAVERERQNKEIGKIEEVIERSGKKLANEKFVENAPAEVVSKEKEKLEKHEETLVKLKETLAQLQ